MNLTWRVNSSPPHTDDIKIGSRILLEASDVFHYSIAAEVKSTGAGGIEVIVVAVFDRQVEGEVRGGEIYEELIGKILNVQLPNIFSIE